MKTIKTVPVDENIMAMVGHCCGGRFPTLQTLEDGIDFTPNAEVTAEMEKLKAAAKRAMPAGDGKAESGTGE